MTLEVARLWLHATLTPRLASQLAILTVKAEHELQSCSQASYPLYFARFMRHCKSVGVLRHRTNCAQCNKQCSIATQSSMTIVCQTFCVSCVPGMLTINMEVRHIHNTLLVVACSLVGQATAELRFASSCSPYQFLAPQKRPVVAWTHLIQVCQDFRVCHTHH